MKKYQGFLDGKLIYEFEDRQSDFARRNFWTKMIKRERVLNLDPSRIKVVEIIED